MERIYASVSSSWGETLQTFGFWFGDGMIPEPLMRRFATPLTCALDFARHHNVTHTGELRVVLTYATAQMNY